jgi:hypothetical protein
VGASYQLQAKDPSATIPFMDRDVSTYKISGNGQVIEGTVKSIYMNSQSMPGLSSETVLFQLYEGPAAIFQFIKGSNNIPASTNISYSIQFTLDLYIAYGSSTIHKTQVIDTTFQVCDARTS